jgi:hypothetical protein
VQFDLYPQKDAINVSKHGLSLAASAQLSAPQLSWDAAFVWIDDLADYGEVRMSALVPALPQVFFYRPAEDVAPALIGCLLGNAKKV